MAIQMNNRAFKRVLQMFPDGKGNFLQSKIWQYFDRKLGYVKKGRVKVEGGRK